MKTAGWIGFFAGAILGCSCQREKLPDPLPGLTVTATPSTGKTTDVLVLEAKPLTSQAENDAFYFRWDWDGDGLWDTKYSTGTKIEHRYLQTGEYLARVEMADGRKQVRSDSILITITQGYSKPRAYFTVTPETGNYLTRFVFDASLTRDDEDSLDQLQFRWDYEGKGFGGYNFSSSPIGETKYSKTGVYNPKLEVRDPSGLVATYTRELRVTAEDTLIKADFTVSKELIRINDTIILDASASVYTPDPRHPLQFSWLLPNRVEWTDPSADPVRVFIVSERGVNRIQLKVTDVTTSLHNIRIKEIIAGDENRPPVARIQVGSANGNILTQFFFDSWHSTDDHQMPSELEVRWDFDGDGNWDTQYSTEKTIYYQYSRPGEYNARLQVRDRSMLTGIDSKMIYVSANANPTGYFRDSRDDQFYGTVTIGGQTWMSQNLNYTIQQKQKEGMYQWLCLNEQAPWCEKAGKMYRIGAVIENRADQEFTAICPTGWRLPSREDWELLFSSIGGESGIRELRHGGRYDFNGQDLGYADWKFFTVAGIIKDTLYFFEQTFNSMHYFSTTEPFDPTGTRTDIWMWSVDRYTGETWTGFNDTRYYMPVRCIKEN
ncbi:MAG: FISUMP domain-containing protein [Bacteroidales bacterium]